MELARIGRIVSLPVIVAIALAAPKKQPGPSDRAVAKWTTGQLKRILVVSAERNFDGIGWSDSLIKAEELAKQSGRPIFLFTYDGDISSGRC